MPSIYTHNRFGEQVFKQLPKEMKEHIKPNMTQFRIGLQGPDFLFFYHPLIKRMPNKLGHAQHKAPAKDFFEPLLPLLRRLGYDSAEYAYAIGYICHFMLDSESHGYVNKKSKENGFNHLVMEIEFDRYLMELDGINPLTYPIWNYVPRDTKTIKTISHIYRKLGIKEKQIAVSLKGMHFYKKLFTTGKSLKRFLIRAGMKLTLYYRELEGHMMNLVPQNSSKITNPKLMDCYERAIPKTVDIICEFHNGLFAEAPLNPRFSCNFQNNSSKEMKQI